jgi:ubiquinone biosynthesis protein
MNWEFLLDEAALASVLPGDYARFARPVRDGLAVFLQGLPADRQEAILQEQLSLAPTTAISERLGLLARSCPVLQKLGQILARDPRLAPALRRRLRELESLPPSVPCEVIQEVLTRELGPLDRQGITLAPPALAEASVAVVIPFRVETGSNGPQHGVFKILKPGIEERLIHELGLLEQVGAHLDQQCEDLHIPRLDYQELFQQVRDKLQYEVRLDLEQQHLHAARTIYADEPRVMVPAPLPWCTPRVTAMERVLGTKVTDQLAGANGGSRRWADLIIDALIVQPLFSRSTEALFHSDPHAGNLFLTADRRLAILDWSLVGCLSQRQRSTLVQILLAALTLRPQRIATLLEELAERRSIDQSALQAVVQNRLSHIRGGRLPGLSWLVGLLDEAVQTARLRMGANLLLFRKSLHTLEGVVGDLGADKREIDRLLWREFLARFVSEWPWRWLAPPWSRTFATHLSNADLTHTMLTMPCTAARYWLGSCPPAPAQ